MAREFARMRLSSFDDPDLEELSADAQWLYFRVLMPHPGLSAAGILPWKPKHWVRKAADMTLERVMAAAAELEHRRYILVDLETEEGLVRSHVRSDEPLRNPRMASAVVAAFRTAASRSLQAAVVTEVARIHAEHLEYSSWDHKDSKAGLAMMLSRPDLSAVGYTYAFAADFTNLDSVDNTDINPVENGDGQPVHNGYLDPVENTYTNPVENGDVDPDAEHLYESGRVPNSNSNLNTQQQQPGGYVSRERHYANTSERNDPPPAHLPESEPADPEPPRYCPHHPEGTSASCRACGAAREAHELWEDERDRRQAESEARERHRAAEVRAAAIAACGMCDDEGRIDGWVCHHDPERMPKPGRAAAALRQAQCAQCDADGRRHDDGSECDHKAALAEQESS